MESIASASGVLLLRDVPLDVRARAGLAGVSVLQPWVRIQRGVLIREGLCDLVDEGEEEEEECLLLVRTPTHDDAFYVCTSREAETLAMSVLQRIEGSVRAQLTRACSRTWQPDAATIAIIDAERPPRQRGLAQLQLRLAYPRYTAIQLQVTPAQEISTNGRYTQMLTPARYCREMVTQRRVSVSVQAKPFVQTACTQTPLRYPKTTWTQYTFTYPELPPPTEDFLAHFDARLRDLEQEHLLEALLHNASLNFFSLDYQPHMPPFNPAPPIDYVLCAVLKDVVRCKDQVIHAFVTIGDRRIAIAYGCQAWRASKRQKVLPCAIDFNVVLVWDRADCVQPQMLLDTLGHDVVSLAFSAHGYLLGGCANGQVLIWRLSPDLETASLPTPAFLACMYRCPLETVTMRVVKPLGMSSVECSHVEGVIAIGWLNADQLPEELSHPNKDSTTQFYTIGVEGMLKLWNYPLELTKSHWDTIRRKRIEKRTILQLQPYFEVRLAEAPISCVHFCNGNFLIMGTFLGAMLSCEWNAKRGVFECSRFDMGEHDGPIRRIERHVHFRDVVLCVGGGTFTIWRLSTANKWCLVMQRRRQCSGMGLVYTDGKWFDNGICLSRNDGCLEFWDFRERSDRYLDTLSVTSGEILEILLEGDQVLFTETTGSLRVIQLVHSGIVEGGSAAELASCRKMFDENAACHSTYRRKQEAAGLRLREEMKLVQLRAVMPKRSEKHSEVSYEVATVLRQKGLVLADEQVLQRPLQEARAADERLRRKLRAANDESRMPALFSAGVAAHLPLFIASQMPHATATSDTSGLTRVEEEMASFTVSCVELQAFVDEHRFAFATPEKEEHSQMPTTVSAAIADGWRKQRLQRLRQQRRMRKVPDPPSLPSS